jgi:hypothetical protein
MKPRLFFVIILVAVNLAACAPATTTQPTTAPPVVELASATPAVSVEGGVTQPPVAIDAPTQPVLPIATSRGPNLEATDPSTVSLASGQYQFVEFFRFT